MDSLDVTIKCMALGVMSVVFLILCLVLVRLAAAFIPANRAADKNAAGKGKASSSKVGTVVE
jgi:ABC-type lipoprotein release transport system permease subunit